MMKLARAAMAIIGLRALVVATRREMMIDREPPSRSMLRRQMVIARWQSTADGGLEARGGAEPPAA
jgi:hypothetical protein